MCEFFHLAHHCAPAGGACTEEVKGDEAAEVQRQVATPRSAWGLKGGLCNDKMTSLVLRSQAMQHHSRQPLARPRSEYISLSATGT